MLISIVIPLYNKAPYIERAVRSVLTQSYENWELIIIDDGSTDEGPALVERFLSDRVSLVRQPNAGVSAARNRGADLSRGEYLVFLDADDEWFPPFLERVAGLIDQNPQAGMFICRHQTVRSTGAIILHPLHLTDGHLGEVPYFLDTMRRNPWVLQTSSTCFNKVAFMATGGFPLGARLGEDTFVFLQVARNWPVLFDARTSGRYYAGLEHSLVSTTRHTIPYYVEYFLAEGTALRSDRHLRGYIMRQAFAYAGIGVRERNRDNAWLLARGTWPYDKWTSFRCALMASMPFWMFRSLLAARNRLRESKFLPSRIEIVGSVGQSD